MLHEAMGAIDPTTGQPRGYLRLSANTRPDSVLFTLDIRPDGSWQQAEAFIQSTAPQLVQVRLGVTHGGVPKGQESCSGFRVWSTMAVA